MRRQTCLIDVTPESMLYRFMPFQRLLGMIKAQEMYVGNTAAWEDSYENFLAKANFYFQGNRMSYKGYIGNYFGQSWTNCPESDALWRIYSPDKNGVRISVNAGHLNTICLQADLASSFRSVTVIRKVTYMETKEVHTWMQEVCQKFMPNMADLKESLFIKRRAFMHEQEIRLLIQRQRKDENEKPEQFLLIPVDTNQLIDEVLFDPRLPKPDVELNIHILKAMGYSGKTGQSSLYGDIDFEYRF
jgi:hypothetical protein